jgi:hypothetical protein
VERIFCAFSFYRNGNQSYKRPSGLLFSKANEWLLDVMGMYDAKPLI